LAAVVALTAAGAASAQNIPNIERSGETFHVAVCGAAAPGSARCHAHLVTDSSGAPIRLIVGGGRVLSQGVARVSGGPYGPGQLRAAYGITGAGAPSTVVGIVDAYGYPNAAADVAAYRQQYGLPPLSCSRGAPCLKIVNETGGTKLPNANAGWDEEQALDLDMVSAMCPDCSIVLVEASSASYADLATAEGEAASLGAHAIGNSYGGGENGSQPYASAYDLPGVAVTASAGDSGYGVAFPASSPFAIAVGGTSLLWNGAARTETVWSGTGSGCSGVYAEQPWQAPASPGMANNVSCRMRMMNDVAAVADPDTGVIVYMNIPPYAPGFYIFGGTSASAQIISGIYGEKDNAVTSGGKPDPYAAYKSLFDVTSGSDGSCGGTYFCTAKVGYDGPTGLGAPIGDAAF
jgi:subtilase family serine protease